MISFGWELTWFWVLLTVAGSAGLTCYKTKVNGTENCTNSAGDKYVSCALVIYPGDKIWYGCIAWTDLGHDLNNVKVGTCGKVNVGRPITCSLCTLCHCGEDNCDPTTVCRLDEHDYCKLIPKTTPEMTTTPVFSTLPVRPSGASACGGGLSLVAAAACAIFAVF